MRGRTKLGVEHLEKKYIIYLWQTLFSFMLETYVARLEN